MTSSSEVTNDLYLELSADVRRELANHEQVITFPRGTKLLQSGTSPGRLIILNSGSAETFVQAAGKNVSLGVTGPGKVFGLQSIISGVLPIVNVTCLEQCEVILLPEKAFLDVLQRYPQMYAAVVKVLCSDLTAADRAIRNYTRGSANRTRLKHAKRG